MFAEGMAGSKVDKEELRVQARREPTSAQQAGDAQAGRSCAHREATGAVQEMGAVSF